MVKGMSSTSLQDWKAVTASLLPQKRRWYDAGGFPYRSARTKQPRYAPGYLYLSRWLPWLRRCAQRTQVYLKLMIIRVNLQFLYRRPNQYKRKLSEWDIYLCIYKRIYYQNLYVSITLYQITLVRYRLAIQYICQYIIDNIQISQWRSFFTLICGTYLDTETRFKQLALNTIKRTVVSALQLPVFFFLNVTTVYVWNLGYWNEFTYHPFVANWYQYQIPNSAACWFYGLTFCFIHLIAFSVNCISLLVKKAHQIYYARAVVYLVYAIIIGFTTNQVQVMECPTQALETTSLQHMHRDYLLCSSLFGQGPNALCFHFGLIYSSGA
ncbi:Hypothetical_protein [Hexamita inflata]|uniref:Hypothetical_protein n=1 Tax=Hexamita inflata TaxID=28002 RepID=A0AA86UAH9_9EUKA|nr:Hypothetical protein HINF_LOCUS37545 [Hexamita inflata]